MYKPELSAFLTFLVIQLSSSELTHSEAQRQLENAGISVSGFCSHRGSILCTSFEGIREDTINGLVDLRNKSGCTFVVIGGTETGYTNYGPYTHENGYRANISPNTCINAYILSHMTCNRVDQSVSDVFLCEDQSGNKIGYFRNHWDAAFYPKSSTGTTTTYYRQRVATFYYI